MVSEPERSESDAECTQKCSGSDSNVVTLLMVMLLIISTASINGVSGGFVDLRGH